MSLLKLINNALISLIIPILGKLFSLNYLIIAELFENFNYLY